MAATERHFTCKEVAEMWKVSDDLVRRLFYNVTGVLKIAQPARRGKRSYVTLRIPESILQRRHVELHGKAA